MNALSTLIFYDTVQKTSFGIRYSETFDVYRIIPMLETAFLSHQTRDETRDCSFIIDDLIQAGPNFFPLQPDENQQFQLDGKICFLISLNQENWEISMGVSSDSVAAEDPFPIEFPLDRATIGYANWNHLGKICITSETTLSPGDITEALNFIDAPGTWILWVAGILFAAIGVASPLMAGKLMSRIGPVSLNFGIIFNALSVVCIASGIGILAIWLLGILIWGNSGWNRAVVSWWADFLANLICAFLISFPAMSGLPLAIIFYLMRPDFLFPPFETLPNPWPFVGGGILTINGMTILLVVIYAAKAKYQARPFLMK